MTTDIKERLRTLSFAMGKIGADSLERLYEEAASRIEQLEGQLSAQTAVKTEHCGKAICKVCDDQIAFETEQPSLSDALDIYEAQTEALPLGYDIPERGSSAYNWQTAVIRDIRALLEQRQDSDKDPMDWTLPCDVFVGHGTFKKGVKLRTLVARMKVLYEMATGKDADAIANGAPK